MAYWELGMIEVRAALGRFTLGGARAGDRSRPSTSLAERLTAQRAQVEGWLAEGLRLTKIYGGWPLSCIASRSASWGSGRRR